MGSFWWPSFLTSSLFVVLSFSLTHVLELSALSCPHCTPTIRAMRVGRKLCMCSFMVLPIKLTAWVPLSTYPHSGTNGLKSLSRRDNPAPSRQGPSMRRPTVEYTLSNVFTPGSQVFIIESERRRKASSAHRHAAERLAGAIGAAADSLRISRANLIMEAACRAWKANRGDLPYPEHRMHGNRRGPKPKRPLPLQSTPWKGNSTSLWLKSKYW